MDSNLEDCPTGILVDFEDITAVSISSDCNNGLSSDLSVSNAVLLKSSHGTEDLSNGCQNVLVNGDHKISHSNCLGAELRSKQDEVCSSRIEWRSPSPTTMYMIKREACRIVDQMHTTMETFLWEEEFPLSCISEDEDVDNGYNKSSPNILLKENCHAVENTIAPSTGKYIAADRSEISTDIQEIYVSNKNHCVNESSTTTGSNPAVPEDAAIRISTEDNSVPIEKSNLPTNADSNVPVESGFIDFTNIINSVSTKETNVPTQVDNIRFSEESNTVSELDMIKIIIEMDNIVSTKRRSTLTVVNSIVPSEIDSSAPDEVDSCAHNEVDSTVPNEVDSSAQNEADSSVPNEVNSRVQNEVDSSVQNEVDSSVQNEVDSSVQNKVDNRVQNEVDCSVPNEIDSSTQNVVDCIVPNDVDCRSPNKVDSNAQNEVECSASNEVDFNVIHALDHLPEYSNNADVVEEGNLSVFGEHKQKLPISKTLKPNGKIMGNTPLSVKSRLAKIFKTPSFRSPNKCKSEEKENASKGCEQNLSAKKISKTGPVFSVKGILTTSNSKGSIAAPGKSSIQTPLRKCNVGKMPLPSTNNSNGSQNQAKENPQKLDTPLRRMSIAKSQPPVTGKTPLGKSYSLRAKAETPNTSKSVRRSSSFQTRPIENAYQLKKERSFIGESQPGNFRSRMSLAQTQPIGNKLETPSKIGSFLPKSTAANAFGTPFSAKSKLPAKELQTFRPPVGSAVRPTKAPFQCVPEVVGLRRPASTTSKTRFTSRLEMPSPLPKMLNDNLSRRLFPDYATPLKRRS